MTDSRQLDSALEEFFETGTDELADRVLEAALLQIDSTQQRRRSPASGRTLTMNTQLRLAVAAVVGVLAIGGAIFALSPKADVGSPTPTPGISPAPSASGQASLFRVIGSPATDRTVRGITVRLADGRVLIAGGTDTESRTADLYDPATGTWSPTGSMHDARSYPVAVRLKDGRVLVAGGHDATTVGDLDSVELYDATTGTWSTIAPMHQTRQQFFAAVLADGRVLVGGGLRGQGVQQSAEVYDPATGAWTDTGDLVMARAGPLAATLLNDGRVLISGGLTDDNHSSELYDPTTGKWALTGSTAGIRADEQTAVVLPDGRVLDIGGDPALAATAELFDPVTGKWSAGPNPAVHHADLEASVKLPDGRLLLVSASATGVNAVAELFDPTTAQWSLLGPLNGTRYVQSATLLPDGSVLVVGSSKSFFVTKPFVGGTPSAELLAAANIP